jgi:putative PIN family toxin of toxin-antitoxin system
LNKLKLTVEAIINEYNNLVEYVQPAAVPSGVVRDPKDEMILACAVGGKAAYIIRGDLDLLDMGWAFMKRSPSSPYAILSSKS